MQPRARRAFRRFLKKHFAVVSILAPYHSLQIPYVSIQYPKMSYMYLLKEKQRCLGRSPLREFSRQNGRKIQVKPKCRLQPEIANLVSRRTNRCTFFLRTTVFKHFGLCITPCRFYLETSRQRTCNTITADNKI
jgi:hypothetical protein